MIDWNQWFIDYLDMLAACARHDSESLALLEYYAVPLLIAGDEGFAALASIDDVIALMRGQVDGLRAAGYHHTDVLHADLKVLNSSSALYKGAFSQCRDDGTEMDAVTMTYLLTNGAVGVRISMIAVHDIASGTAARYSPRAASTAPDEECRPMSLVGESVEPVADGPP
jgi:hypothetical protein